MLRFPPGFRAFYFNEFPACDSIYIERDSRKSASPLWRKRLCILKTFCESTGPEIIGKEMHYGKRKKHKKRQ